MDYGVECVFPFLVITKRSSKVTAIRRSQLQVSVIKMIHSAVGLHGPAVCMLTI